MRNESRGSVFHTMRCNGYGNGCGCDLRGDRGGEAGSDSSFVRDDSSECFFRRKVWGIENEWMSSDGFRLLLFCGGTR